ncbi:MAG: hypothetical protein NT157_01855 [Candidatus Micrarchaeota archaeon]|nr:hypothetical protein [Candidatus Micrarchaeota archaeon]
MEKKLALAFALAFLMFISGCVVITGSCAMPGRDCDAVNTCCSGLVCGSDSKCRYTTESYWDDWRSAALIGVIISVMLVSLAYMFASLIGHSQLKAWAKNELFQAFASAFIIGSLIALIALTSSGLRALIIPAALPAEYAAALPAEYIAIYGPGQIAANDPNPHITLAYVYMQKTLIDLKAMAYNMLKTYRYTMWFAYANMTFNEYIHPWLGVKSAPLIGLSIAGESMSTAFDILVKMMLIVTVQQALLELIRDALFPALLVMGIIFRTFFFTRKLGGLLIAMAIGLYLVYPITFILMHNLMKAGTGEYVINVDAEEFVRETGLAYPDDPVGLWDKITTGQITAANLLEIPRHLGGIVGRFFNENWLIGERGYLDKTAKWMMYGTFVPFITLMATVAFVRNLSPILGGDVEIAGLTRII